jgi:hypothetical protein
MMATDEFAEILEDIMEGYHHLTIDQSVFDEWQLDRDEVKRHLMHLKGRGKIIFWVAGVDNGFFVAR